MPFDPATIDSWSEEEIAHFKRQNLKPQVQLEFLAAGGPGPLVAEGDSWFDYPVPLAVDILECLRGFHGFQIEKHAKYGDTLENMIFGIGVTTLMQAVRETRPKALLFSGGGNDVAFHQMAAADRLSKLPPVC